MHESIILLDLINGKSFQVLPARVPVNFLQIAGVIDVLEKIPKYPFLVRTRLMPSKQSTQKEFFIKKVGWMDQIKNGYGIYELLSGIENIEQTLDEFKKTYPEGSRLIPPPEYLG